MNNSEDYWLSRPDLAGRLKLPVTTLTKWAYEKKKGPRYVKIGRHCRYKLSDVIAWEDAQYSAASGD